MPADEQLTLVVSEKRILSSGVVGLRLARPDGRPLPVWQSGAHIDLHLPGDLTRQYSLCGAARDESHWRVGVLLEEKGRGGSRYIHSDLNAGDFIIASGPRNHFPLVAADSYLFIGGGIGITPLIPMIAEVNERGLPWRLVYGGRTTASMAFVDELLTYGPRVTLWPDDEMGLIDLPALLSVPVPGQKVYCCGPEVLLNAVQVACASWPEQSLHVEHFHPKALGSEVLPNTSFEVELARSGQVIQVGADQSILGVLRDSDIDVLWSCEDGTCGTCETAVLAGQPEHRDSVLTADEQAANDLMMICVSRACSARLVLDI